MALLSFSDFLDVAFELACSLLVVALDFREFKLAECFIETIQFEVRERGLHIGIQVARS